MQNTHHLFTDTTMYNHRAAGVLGYERNSLMCSVRMVHHPPLETKSSTASWKTGGRIVKEAFISSPQLASPLPDSED